jgi:hypothetical protein
VAYNDLDNNEMASLFSPIVKNPDVKKQFLSIKEVAGFHDQVEEAYQAILAVKPPDESTDEQLKQITAKQKPLDYRHDRLARVIGLTLEAQRDLALSAETPDEERAEACDTVFNAIFPDGMGIINASYLAESGNTERVQTLLESADGPAIKAVLKTIHVDKKTTLLDVVGTWIELGAALGELEVKKGARLAELASVPAVPPRVVQQARSQWIAIATIVGSALAVSKAPLALKNAIGHPLKNAAAKAGKRGAAKAAAPEDAAAGEPAAAPEAGEKAGETPAGG